MAERKGEPLNQLMARFMSSKKEERPTLTLKQRLASGYLESRRQKSK